MVTDGERFKSAIMELANNPLAAGLSAKVSKVTLQGADTAKVVFSIYLNNIAAFRDQVGYAYKRDGKWLVGSDDLCKLVEAGGTTPKACTT